MLTFQLILLWYFTITCHTTNVFSTNTSIVQNFNSTTSKYEEIEILGSKLIYYDEISRLEQTRSVGLNFLENNINVTFESPQDLANSVIHYLIDKNEEKITKIATLLLKPVGEYGANPEENLLETQKMVVIHDWLQHLLFNQSFNQWILEEISKLIKSTEENTLVFHGNLERRFLNYLSKNTSLGLLTSEALNYYKNNILSDYMPSFKLQLSNVNNKNKLKYMHLSQPEFGYLHAGLKVMEDINQINNTNTSLDEIIYLGILFENIFRTVNPEFNTYFELPAKIYCVSTLNYTVPRTDWELCYEKYFNFLDSFKSIKDNNSTSGKWKTRPELAKEELKIHNVSEDYLNQYLLYGESKRLFMNKQGKEVILNSIDEIFEKQNKNVSKAFNALDKLQLSNFFNSIENVISLSDKKFIQKAEIDMVRVEFINPKSTSNICVGMICGPMKDDGGKLKTRVPENEINMLRCRVMDENERIYALKADVGEYKMYRVDYNKSAILDLFTHFPEVRKNENFEINVSKLSQIKKEEEPLEVVADKLSKLHSDQLYAILKDLGYEPTFWQKLIDFLPRLIPFYSCVDESMHGDPGLAVLSCTVDALTFIPFIGQSLKVAHAFGTTSIQAILTSLRIGARQATIRAALREVEKEMVSSGIPFIQKSVPSSTYLNLGYTLLHTVDPGIGLLRLGGKGVVKLITQASIKLEKIIPSLKAFAKISNDKILSKLPDVDPSKIVKAFSADYNKEIPVVVIGKEHGQNIHARIDLETNVLFGRRYIIDQKTGFLELAPISIRDKIYKFKTIELGGDGPIVAGKKWSKEPTESIELQSHGFNKEGQASTNVKLWKELPFEVKQIQRANGASQLYEKFDWSEDTYVSLKSYARTNLVYRLDTRPPKKITKSGGLLTRPAMSLDYDMNNHNSYFSESDSTEIRSTASAFVSCSPKLRQVVDHLRFFERHIFNQLFYERSTSCFKFLCDSLFKTPVAYVYKIRPDQSFYNLEASYLAAGDVSVPGTRRRSQLHRLGKYWDAGLEEYVALNGIPKERIIAWAPIYSINPRDVDIETLKWHKNPDYDSSFDTDISNENVYTYVNIKKKEDAMDMGINIVQMVTGKDKIQAKDWIIEKKVDYLKIVKNYHTLSKQELEKMIFV